MRVITRKQFAPALALGALRSYADRKPMWSVFVQDLRTGSASARRLRIQVSSHQPYSDFDMKRMTLGGLSWCEPSQVWGSELFPDVT